MVVFELASWFSVDASERVSEPLGLVFIVALSVTLISLPRGPLRGHQPVRNPREACHHHAQGAPERMLARRGTRIS